MILGSIEQRLNTFHFANTQRGYVSARSSFRREFINVDDNELLYWYILLGALIYEGADGEPMIGYAFCAVARLDGVAIYGGETICIAITRTRCSRPDFSFILWNKKTSRVTEMDRADFIKKYYCDFETPFDYDLAKKARFTFFKQQNWFIRPELLFPIDAKRPGNFNSMTQLKTMQLCQDRFDAHTIYHGQADIQIKSKKVGEHLRPVVLESIHSPVIPMVENKKPRAGTSCVKVTPTKKRMTKVESEVEKKAKELQDIESQLLKRKRELASADRKPTPPPVVDKKMKFVDDANSIFIRQTHSILAETTQLTNFISSLPPTVLANPEIFKMVIDAHTASSARHHSK
jgi:hypothetical protein